MKLISSDIDTGMTHSKQGSHIANCKVAFQVLHTVLATVFVQDTQVLALIRSYGLLKVSKVYLR